MCEKKRFSKGMNFIFLLPVEVLTTLGHWQSLHDNDPINLHFDKHQRNLVHCLYLHAYLHIYNLYLDKESAKKNLEKESAKIKAVKHLHTVFLPSASVSMMP